jgi:hypothetical protein
MWWDGGLAAALYSLPYFNRGSLSTDRDWQEKQSFTDHWSSQPG